jgi:hypothetical protein
LIVPPPAAVREAREPANVAGADVQRQRWEARDAFSENRFDSCNCGMEPAFQGIAER